MAKAVAPWIVGKEFCDALGIDPSKFTSMTIRIGPDEGALVELKGVVTDDETKAISKVLTQYRLVPRQLVDGASDNGDGEF